MSHTLVQIKASAGSGKTSDLTRRFLLHLQHMEEKSCEPACLLHPHERSWGDILAVTFTNAAATEMKQRVLVALKDIALHDAAQRDPRLRGITLSPQQAARWVDIILRQYGSLNIRTIDSLLHLLVRNAAISLDLPPDFEPAFASDDVLMPLLDNLALQAEGEQHPLTGSLQKACRSLARDHKAKGFTLGDKLLNALRPFLDGALREEYAHLPPKEDLRKKYNDIQENVRTAAQHLLQVAHNHAAWNTNALKAVQNMTKEIFPEKSSAYLSKNSFQDCIKKNFRNSVPEDAEQCFQLLARTSETFYSSGILLKKSLSIYPFVDLANALATSFRQTMSQEGRLPTSLIPGLAKDIFSFEYGIPDALCRLGSRLTHFLLDEFQDTSQEQWEAMHPLILDALSRGGSLTWVGDVKQAIYRWRGGNAALFDDIGKDSELVAIAGTLQRDPLTTNWRSKKNIIACNNALFQNCAHEETLDVLLPLLLPQECPPEIINRGKKLFAAAYAQAAQDIPGHILSDDEPGKVTFCHIEGIESSELNKNILEELSTRLHHDLHTRHSWGDMAILTRSNNAASMVAEHLLHEGIPVITENSLLLQEHPIISQALHFLRFLRNSSDDLACAGLLAGSLFNSLDDVAQSDFCPEKLFSLAAMRKSTLLGAFRHQWRHLWQNHLAPFHNQAGLMTPYDAVQEWFRHTQITQREPEAATFLQRFLEILHMAEREGRQTIPTFLDHWNAKGGTEKIPMPENIDAIRIMTIHKAKGLQFPVVILPWTNFTIKADTHPCLVQIEGVQTLVPCSKELPQQYYESYIKNALEECNMLYVGLTRAEKELLCFQTNTTNSKGGKTTAQAFTLLMEQASITCSPLLTETLSQEAAHTTLPQPDEAKATISTLSSDIPTTDPSNILQSSFMEYDVTQNESEAYTPAHLENEEILAPMGWLPRLKIFRNPLGQEILTPTDRGTLLHSCLERLILPMPSQSPKSTDAPRPQQGTLLPSPKRQGRQNNCELSLTSHISNVIRQVLRAYPSSIRNNVLLQEELEKALSWFAAQPEAPFWKQHGIPEQTIADATGKLQRVDLLVESPAHWLVIDFKSGTPHEANKKQMRDYTGLLQNITTKPIHSLLLYPDRQCMHLKTEAGTWTEGASYQECLQHQGEGEF